MSENCVCRDDGVNESREGRTVRSDQWRLSWHGTLVTLAYTLFQ